MISVVAAGCGRWAVQEEEVIMKLRMLSVGAMLLCLSSCAVIFDRPEPAIVVREDVVLCFRQSPQAYITAEVQPAACYSMRCTKQIQLMGTAILNRDEFQIRFTPSFQFAKTKPFLLPCTDDCAGGGRLTFDLGVLDVGLYQVHVWDRAMGELSVTSGMPWQDQCLPADG